MFSLKISNRTLYQNCKSSNLSTNFPSAVSAVTVINISCAVIPAPDVITRYFALFGEFGSEACELKNISSIVEATNTINLTTPLKYGHSADTCVRILRYDMARFYRNTTATFAGSTILDTISLQPDSLNTVFGDSINSTGWGFTAFFNSVTAGYSTPSNAIPYSGFENNTCKDILDNFYSLLNDTEKKSISTQECFRWMSEGLGIIRTNIALINPDFPVPSEWSFTVTPTTSTASLPSDFFELISITDVDGNKITKIDLPDIRYNDANGSASSPYYYIRNMTVGISPAVTASTTFYMNYKSQSPAITSITDVVDIPPNQHFILVDFMLYRAAMKITRFNEVNQKRIWDEDIKNLKLASFSQDHNDDRWGIDYYANV